MIEYVTALTYCVAYGYRSNVTNRNSESFQKNSTIFPISDSDTKLFQSDEKFEICNYAL